MSAASSSSQPAPTPGASQSYKVVPLIFSSQSPLPKTLHVAKFDVKPFPPFHRGGAVLPPAPETNDKPLNPKSLKARQQKFQSKAQKEEQARLQKLLAGRPNSGASKWKITDNKGKTFEGSPDAPNSESNLFLFAVPPGNSDTVYACAVDMLRFKPMVTYGNLSLEEAEAQMNASTKVPRFIKSEEVKGLLEEPKKPVVDDDDDGGLELGGEEAITSGVQSAKPKKKAKKSRAGKEDGDDDNDDEAEDDGGGDGPAEDGEDGDAADGYAGPSEGASASVLDEEVEADEPDQKAEGLDFKENFDDDEEVVNEDAPLPSTAAAEEGLESDDEGGAPKRKNQKLSKHGKRIEELLSDKKTVQPMVAAANIEDSEEDGDADDDDDDDDVSDLDISEDDEDEDAEDSEDDEAVGSKRKKPSDKERPSTKKQKTVELRFLTELDLAKALSGPPPVKMTLKALAAHLATQGFDVQSEPGRAKFVAALKAVTVLRNTPQGKIVELKTGS